MIFCGSAEKAKECEKKYKDKIFKATFDYGGVIDALQKEDEAQQSKIKAFKLQKDVVWVYDSKETHNLAKSNTKQLRWNYGVRIQVVDRE